MVADLLEMQVVLVDLVVVVVVHGAASSRRSSSSGLPLGQATLAHRRLQIPNANASANAKARW